MRRVGLLARLPEADDLAAEPAEAPDRDLGQRGLVVADADDPALDDDAVSSTEASRAAIARTLAWMSRQAVWMARPMITVERLAEVCWS